eukprot:354077-Chlamydomonas_euryale.AAC.2
MRRSAGAGGRAAGASAAACAPLDTRTDRVGALGARSCRSACPPLSRSRTAAGARVTETGDDSPPRRALQACGGLGGRRPRPRRLAVGTFVPRAASGCVVPIHRLLPPDSGVVSFFHGLILPHLQATEGASHLRNFRPPPPPRAPRCR